MKKWLRRMILALCLTLLVASIAAWIASLKQRRIAVNCSFHRWTGEVAFEPGGWAFTIIQDVDPADFSKLDYNFIAGKGTHFAQNEDSPLYPAIMIGAMLNGIKSHDLKAFGLLHGKIDTITFWLVIFPFWEISCVLALLSAWAAWRPLRNIRRRRRGLCPQCGYDLRASSGRCPECGWLRQEITEHTKAT